MKILKLTAENVKKLTAVEITPDAKGGLVIISGRNGSGKSSVLDSIMMALGGKDNFTAKPVRRGEDKARIEIDLGEFTVTRTITPQGGGTLIVRNKDAQKIESPQTLLDGLFGKLTFDPLEFRTMKPDKRSETLQALVGLDFKAKEAEIARVFNERTVINREAKSLENQLVACKEYPDIPAEEVSAASILEEQRKASEFNKSNADRRRARESLESTIKARNVSIAHHERNIARLKSELVDEEQRLSHSKTLLTQDQTDLLKFDSIPIPEDVELSSFSARVTAVEQTNLKVRANQQKAKLRTDHKAKVKEAEALTTKIEALEKEKRKAIQDAKFPVEGLSLSDTREVEFNGIPFDEVNTADQLRVSVAMGLAMNPKLRVLLVRQGNDLDDTNLKLIAEMAEKADAQIWLEKVNPDGAVAVIIEDGHIKEPEPVKQGELV